MKKTKLWWASILMMVALLFVGCDFGSGGSDEEDNTEETGIEKGENGESILSSKKSDKLSFSSGGFSALALVDENDAGRSVRSARGARAADATSDALIVKILEDGSMQSFLSVPENVTLSKICYIAKSPLADAKEIYIVFQNETWWGEDVYNEDGSWKEWKQYSIGQLICVKEDGSFIDILEKEDGTHKWLYNASRDSVYFDNYGNVYYLVNEGSGNDYTNMIYKFNPRNGTNVQLTSPVPNTYYDKMMISKDGQWIFAKGGRWAQNSSSQFLRAIPVATPDFPINIFYESNNSNWINDWYYDDDANAIYYIQNSTLYRIAQKDGTFDKANKEELFSSDNGGYSNFWSDALLSWSSSSVTTWTGYSSAGNNIRDEDDENYENGSNYYFRDPSDIEKIQPEVILNYLYAQAYSSFDTYTHYDKNGQPYCKITWDQWKEDFKDHKYEIRFDKFAEVEGYETLASLTEGKSDLELIKAIIANNLEGLLYSLLSESGRYNSTKYFPSWYDYNFFADILYEKGTDKNISEELFYRNTHDGIAKFSDMGLSVWNVFTTEYASGYTWKESLTEIKTTTTSSGATKKSVVKADEVLKVLAQYCNKDKIDFSLECFKDDAKYSILYTELKNEEAVEFLDNPVRLKKLSDYFCDDNNRDDRNGYGKFLLNTCFVKDSDYKTPAYTWRKSDNETIWWGNVNSLTPSYGKSLYGVYNNYSSNGKGCGLIKIIDEDGNKDGQYISALNDYKLSDLQTAESGFYFRSALLDSEGEETGQHQVMFYNAESEALENLFEKVANNKELEVVSFSVGGDYVYYCAARGITVMNGKINIRTKEAQLLSADRKLSQIISIK